LVKGYLSVAYKFLLPAEIENMVFAGLLMTYENGIRFLSDYLNGDIYFPVKHPAHNLQRARTQFKLVNEIKTNQDKMNAIIEKEWFDAAIDAHIKLGIEPTGAVVATHDPADEGDDSKGYACRKGIFYFDVDELEAPDGNQGCDLATARAINSNADLFVFDGDGMGALLRRQIAQSFSGIKCELRMYRGSNEVEDKRALYDGMHSRGTKGKPKTNADVFYNKRAQYYIKLAQRFYNTYLAVVKKKYIDPDTIISISSEIKLLDKLRSEVCRIPTKPNGAGKIQLMTKKEMKDKHQIESPGMADCLAMGEELPQPIKKPKKINYAGWGG